MTLDALWLVAGLALLLAGGEALIRGASALAERLGVSPVIVGLTVVAFGTSAPELVVCVLAALRGDPGIVFGNVVGSNIANLGLLLGCTALLTPLAVQSSLVAREIPLMILASLVAVVLGLDDLLGAGEAPLLTRGDGLVLLLVFGVFLYTMVGDVVRARARPGSAAAKDPLLTEPLEVPAAGEVPRSVGVMCGLITFGLFGLAAGGHLMVSSASTIAAALGVPSVVIGSTIVAVGTSLPELATSIMAARKGQADLAVGNIIGSNIFNLLFVLGTTASLAPVAVPPGAWVDFVFMAGLAMLTLPMAWTHGRRITRGEGALLVAIYVGAMTWQLLRGG